MSDTTSRIMRRFKQTLGSTKVLLAALLLLLAASPSHAETYFYHTDHLGTPQVLTNKNQTVVWQAALEPFGEVTEAVALVEQNLRFPGQYLDRESGLHYNYFRSYNSDTGRYIESDPIGVLQDYSEPQIQQQSIQYHTGFEGTAFSAINHIYAYANLNPLTYSDFFGLSSTPGGADDECEEEEKKNKNKNINKNKKCEPPKWAKKVAKIAYLLWCLYSQGDNAAGSGSTNAPKPPKLPPEGKPPYTEPRYPPKK